MPEALLEGLAVGLHADAVQMLLLGAAQEDGELLDQLGAVEKAPLRRYLAEALEQSQRGGGGLEIVQQGAAGRRQETEERPSFDAQLLDLDFGERLRVGLEEDLSQAVPGGGRVDVARRPSPVGVAQPLELAAELHQVSAGATASGGAAAEAQRPRAAGGVLEVDRRPRVAVVRIGEDPDAGAMELEVGEADHRVGIAPGGPRGAENAGSRANPVL